MGGRKIATTMYLTPEQDSLLKELSRQTRLPVSELVRRGVDLVIDRHKDHLVGYSHDRERAAIRGR
ncbi:MAG: ribbon-helix-helix domain-containing protein [Deltaproteobacteria bacterium]|jgi:hypothetical protein|nr:ribbon-helix-helix domain-containing protein [Deltaproteobacteria bacterium]